MRKLVATTIILSATITSVFCCCLAHSTEAKEVIKSPCHAQEEQTSSASSETVDCECPELLAIQSNDSISQIFIPQKDFAASLPIVLTKFKKANYIAINHVDTGPPHVNIPLYLKYSVFRI